MQDLTKLSDRKGIRLRWYHFRSVELARNYTRILEVGCGEGLAFGELNTSACGIDISFSRLKSAKKYLGDFVQADAQTLPFRDSSFDCVISNQTIEHIPDTKSFLNELSRILTVGGVVAISTPIPHFGSRLFPRHKNERGEKVLSEDHVSEFHSRSDLEKNLLDGFVAQKWEEHWETKPVRCLKMILDIPLLYYYSDIYVEGKVNKIQSQ